MWMTKILLALSTLSTLSNEDPDYDDNGDYLTKIQKSFLVSFFN